VRHTIIIALLCGCTSQPPRASWIGNRSRVPTENKLDQLGFIAGCWIEVARGITRDYRFCWRRDPMRWQGRLTVRMRSHESDGVTDYIIEEASEQLFVEYADERVPASRIEADTIVFLRPNKRGPDLSLHYDASSDALWVAVFDVIHSFERVR
jgi:hypothetical protein